LEAKIKVPDGHRKMNYIVRHDGDDSQTPDVCQPWRPQADRFNLFHPKNGLALVCNFSSAAPSWRNPVIVASY
jgi:hypothetical protein